MLDPDFFPTAVYRLYDFDGALLYVGMGDARTRIKSHLKTKPWRAEIDRQRTTVEWFDTRQDAETRETAAIAAESPRYNIMGAVKVRATDGVIAQAVSGVTEAELNKDECRDELFKAIGEAVTERGIRQLDIVKQTGYTREHVRRICKAYVSWKAGESDTLKIAR